MTQQVGMDSADSRLRADQLEAHLYGPVLGRQA
jgi:hypothetical protein